mmetsp:Transcript_21947/g.62509  ORF Transcript_21947/g.62509 Transcript_21947/m.62509 type:complete len:561 (-) Transcript_21947:108-1790(-)|eukprot:CAMPEP_0119554930 /NCGR_PEP_ID=MMETSP1352-20130426/7275_1 /TAXON_ID=265584 /ORGANISM="Stauroneis constricta, Strain CCMP1120" /LENGTH=560 /DNA_ID=CAMNT_0007601601 /DNA_START=48 /DNA_END=1730 /DNA_ORIENTATION=-
MKLELSLYAKDLKNVAGAFKGTSDPYAVVTQLSTNDSSPAKVLGKTEVIKNTLSPEWIKVFFLDYELGTPVKIAISLFDEVRKGDNKSMGAAMFDVGALLGARGCTKAKRVKGGGTLFAHVRKSVGQGVLRLKMQGVKLKNTEGFLRKSDPFYELYRKIDSAGAATWDNVYRSNVVMDDLSPNWKEASLELSVLCGGDKDLPIMVKVFDHESKGDHVVMGQFETTVNDLVAKSSGSIELKKAGSRTGTIQVIKAEVSGSEEAIQQQDEFSRHAAPPPGVPTFADYASGGCELNVVVAIDFTGSNGDPRIPGNLHYMGDGKNDYEKAISAIVPILEKYDSDKKVPCLGFGAKYDGEVRHAFQIGDSEELDGTRGVLEAYRSVFRSQLIMSGPTVFVEVMQTAAARAQSRLEAAQAQGKQSYTILLILTDGAVSDVAATKACLEEINETPLSVVIVGVGSADFSSMQFLDDSQSLGERDIAQFVEFNRHCRNPADLSAATLQEIPKQLVGFFQKRGIAPSDEEAIGEDEIVIEPEEEIDLSLDLSNDQEIVVSGGGSASGGW